MERKDTWHDCVVYGRYASFAASLRKGTHLVIEGELMYREYIGTVDVQKASQSTFNGRSPKIVVDSILSWIEAMIVKGELRTRFADDC